jgi:hypothetical protein
MMLTTSEFNSLRADGMNIPPKWRFEYNGGNFSSNLRVDTVLIDGNEGTIIEGGQSMTLRTAQIACTGPVISQEAYSIRHRSSNSKAPYAGVTYAFDRTFIAPPSLAGYVQRGVMRLDDAAGIFTMVKSPDNWCFRPKAKYLDDGKISSDDAEVKQFIPTASQSYPLVNQSIVALTRASFKCDAARLQKKEDMHNTAPDHRARCPMWILGKWRGKEVDQNSGVASSKTPSWDKEISADTREKENDRSSMTIVTVTESGERRVGQIYCAIAALSRVLADSVRDYSGTQGNRGWYYGYYHPINGFTTSGMYYYKSTLAGSNLWCYEQCELFGTVFTQQGGTAGRVFYPTIVRRWVSNITGEVIITGRLADLEVSDDILDFCVRGSIQTSSFGKDVTLINTLWAESVNTMRSSVSLGDLVTGIHVKVIPGSVIDFTVNKVAETFADNFAFEVQISIKDEGFDSSLGYDTSESNAYYVDTVFSEPPALLGYVQRSLYKIADVGPCYSPTAYCQRSHVLDIVEGPPGMCIRPKIQEGAFSLPVPGGFVRRIAYRQLPPSQVLRPVSSMQVDKIWMDAGLSSQKSTVMLSWYPPIRDNHAPIEYYLVQWDTDDNFWSFCVDTSPNSNSKTSSLLNFGDCCQHNEQCNSGICTSDQGGYTCSLGCNTSIVSPFSTVCPSTPSCFHGNGDAENGQCKTQHHAELLCREKHTSGFTFCQIKNETYSDIENFYRGTLDALKFVIKNKVVPTGEGSEEGCTASSWDTLAMLFEHYVFVDANNSNSEEHPLLTPVDNPIDKYCASLVRQLCISTAMLAQNMTNASAMPSAFGFQLRTGSYLWDRVENACRYKRLRYLVGLSGHARVSSMWTS